MLKAMKIKTLGPCLAWAMTWAVKLAVKPMCACHVLLRVHKQGQARSCKGQGGGS